MKAGVKIFVGSSEEKKMKNVVVFYIQNRSRGWLIFKAEFDQPGICMKILSLQNYRTKGQFSYEEFGEM